MPTVDLIHEMTRLDGPAATAALRGAGPTARGFLGLDPVTDNDALLARELARLQAQTFRSGPAVLGFRLNPDQPRQAVVATTSADPAPLRAVLHFLTVYQRCSSWVSFVTVGNPVHDAHIGCGFAEAGVLRDHHFHSGRYHDVTVLVRTEEDPCPS